MKFQDTRPRNAGAGIAWLMAVALFALAACESAPTGRGRIIVPNPGTPRANVTPLAVPATPSAPQATEPPIGTLPPRADPNATVTPDAGGATPDGTVYSRLIYTYTVGIRPIKLVLDISPDGTTRARFGVQDRAGTLPPDRMAAISAAVRHANFFALQDEYIPARTCCDLPGHEFTLFTADGRSKTVEILGPAPEPLVPLINSLGGIWRELPLVE